MSELFAWVPWFQALARKITDNDSDYFVPRARKVLSSAVGPKAPLLKKSDSDLDPFSFFYTLASKNGTKHWKPLHDAISEEFSISPIGVESSKGFYFPTPPGFVGMFQDKPDLLWRLFRDAVRGIESVRQEEFDGALAIKGVGVPKLTQTLFLINPRAFLPFDKLGLAPLRKEIESVHNWRTYRRELKAVRGLFPGCEPYEIQHFAYAVFGIKALRVRPGAFWQSSTFLRGPSGPDYWNEFRENGWIYHRGPGSETKRRPLHKPVRGDIVIVRTGAKRGRGIGIVHQNDHQEKWTPDQRLHVLWLNTVEASVDGLPDQAPAFSAAKKMGDAFRIVPAYKPTFDLLNKLGPVPVPVPPPRPDLAAFSEKVLIAESELRRIVDLLKDKKQVIFQGPPGTGKTYLARELAECLAGSPDRVRLVQFHPSYAYEDFVEGYRPTLKDGQATFKRRKGPLLQIAHRAAKDDKEVQYVLVIDEINRGNLSKILGELYFLLEYRDETIQLQYSSKRFRLPKNLYLIGTMNTADRSIALVDLALRRRFHFVEFHPDKLPIEGLLERWLEAKAPKMTWVKDVVAKANRKLDDRHAAIGPSYFMREGLDEAKVKTIWKHNVLPYIEERLFGQEERLKDFDLDKLRGKPGKDDAAGGSEAGPSTNEAG